VIWKVICSLILIVILAVIPRDRSPLNTSSRSYNSSPDCSSSDCARDSNFNLDYDFGSYFSIDFRSNLDSDSESDFGSYPS